MYGVMMSQIANETRDDAASRNDDALEQVRQALGGLQFGTVTIVVQDGVVIQIERTERRRLKKSERT
jgi:hypothetical protein